jgi:hypothetical protein
VADQGKPKDTMGSYNYVERRLKALDEAKKKKPKE